MKEDLISIIIPVYNSEKYIQETIETIKNQTYKNWEAIFIDDNSTDKSASIIKKSLQYNIKLIELKENSGPSIARNKGIEIAKGKYIVFLDADDLWENRKLELQHKFMKDNNYDFTYTSYKYIHKNGQIGKKVKVKKVMDYKNALKSIRILTTTSMLRVDTIGKQTIMMINLKSSEDVATWWKILKKGYIAYGMEESLAFYRKSDKSRSSDKLKSAKGRWYLYRKVENFSIIKSMYYFSFYIINAVLRRI